MEETKKKPRLKKIWIVNIVVLIFILCFGIIIGRNKLIEKRDSGSLTNPVLDTHVGDVLMDNKNINLEYYLEDYRKSKIQEGEITHLSVYFRNLNNGNRFGIEEKELFSPASLMKLPLLIAYYKKSEYEPGYLEKKIKFTKNGTSDQYRQNVEPENKLEDGQEYKIIDILEHMIRYSDNDASIFLEKNISFDEFKKTFTDIGIEFPPVVDGSFDNNIRVVDYSAFFRILFNSSYLNRENSEKVLKLLTQTEFKDGLSAGVTDRDLIISHKFGERSIFGNNGIERMQLHDCGIVYYPKYPYMLCIMTRGYDWNKLKYILQEVSSIVYESVDEAYSK